MQKNNLFTKKSRKVITNQVDKEKIDKGDIKREDKTLKRREIKYLEKLMNVKK